ncbi:hypothetical protein [Desmospora profundinema]|uniref:Competence protein ComGF n=1 Tax=Desmospora profundinema TaxID=1571184 RepID=A0ABU1IJJ9_9BACL|nr:hypothetical protein [Desmospora profundinema]MDR6224938.1 hypothetical protein [Desmospora profundinema]
MEFSVVLMLLLLFVPVVMSVSFHVEKGMKEAFWEQQLQMELSAFAADVRDEIRSCTHHRLSKEGWLLMETPTGETIRYKHDRRRIIRSVRPLGESRFQGTTILAHDVYWVVFSPDGTGVHVEIGLQNWHGDREARLYFRGRTAP